jgi:hypothetical protein
MSLEVGFGRAYKIGANLAALLDLIFFISPPKKTVGANLEASIKDALR